MLTNTTHQSRRRRSGPGRTACTSKQGHGAEAPKPTSRRPQTAAAGGDESSLARFGMEPGERGSLNVRHASDGGVQGFFVPRASADGDAEAKPGQSTAAGVKIIEIFPAASELRIYPTNTRPWHPDHLGPKYSQIRTLTLPSHLDDEVDLVDALEGLPAGFTKDYEYGLGLAQECDPIIDLIEAHTKCDTLALDPSAETTVDGSTFRMSLARFEALRAELTRIKSRGNGAIRRVRHAFVHNELAEVLGLDEARYSEGRHPTSRWITQVTAGAEPLSDFEQEALLAATRASAAQIAATNPDRLVRLQRDIELVNLEQLISAYGDALWARHNERWWQQFFEENVFALQLLFGGPSVFVDSQVPIGEGGNSAKGKKIADYLFRNATTNNAALVEIKKPSTQLMSKTPYREGVYGVHSEISKSVTQVLDQALQLTRHEGDTQARTPGKSWVSSAPRCFVVAGMASELDTPDKKKSFELFREHLSGVRLVTFDEVHGQLELLRDFLSADAAGSSGPWMSRQRPSQQATSLLRPNDATRLLHHEPRRAIPAGHEPSSSQRRDPAPSPRTA